MTFSCDELNRELLTERKDLTSKQIEFAFAKMDIEKECADAAMAEIREVVKKYTKACADKVLELSEKYFKEKEDD